MGFMKVDEKWMRKRVKVNEAGNFMVVNTRSYFDQSKIAHPYFKLDLE